MEENDMKQVISFFSDEEVKVVWREEDKTKVGRGNITHDDENFVYLASDQQYLESFGRTIFFSVCVAFLSMSLALILAGFADRVIKGALVYRTFLIWPYAVAPALAGALWGFMFDPTLGIWTYFLKFFGFDLSKKHYKLIK